MIAHHTSTVSFWVEVAVAVVTVGLLGAIWLRERRRRAARSDRRGKAAMRD